MLISGALGFLFTNIILIHITENILPLVFIREFFIGSIIVAVVFLFGSALTNTRDLYVFLILHILQFRHPIAFDFRIQIEQIDFFFLSLSLGQNK